MDRILPFFVYKLILTRSRLAFLLAILSKILTESWSLIDVRFSLLLNIIITIIQNFIKFCVHIDINNI